MNVREDRYVRMIEHIAMELEIAKHELESAGMPPEKVVNVMELGVKYACCQIQDVTGFSRAQVASDLADEVSKNDQQRDLKIKALLQ